MHMYLMTQAVDIKTDAIELWIISTSCTDEMLNDLPATRDEAWPDGIYFIGKILRVGIIAVNRLPRTQETLWLRVLGKDLIQKQAIDEVVALPKEDSKRLEILRLLSKWKINMGLDNEIDSAEDRELVMNLTTAYIEWEKETELRGMERGIERGMEIGKETERRSIIENLFLARFGEIDSELTAIIQPILNLSAPEYAALLLQLSNLSREDFLARFRN